MIVGAILLQTQNFWLTLVFIVSIILYFIPALYRLYLRLVGLGKLQEISKWRAFVAAYILAYIFVFIAIILIDIVLVLLIVAIGSLFGLFQI